MSIDIVKIAYSFFDSFFSHKRENKLEDFEEIIIRNFGRLDFYKFLGSGSFGYAYLLSDGTVFKMTTDQAEIDAASIVLDNPLENVVEIYDVKITKQRFKIAGREQGIPVGFIISEYVPYDLPKHIKSVLYKITLRNKLENEIFHSKISRTKLREASESLINLLYDKYGSTGYDVFNQVANAVSQLNYIGIYYIDAHPGNIKVTENDIVKIIDLGFGSSLRKSENVTEINKP